MNTGEHYESGNLDTNVKCTNMFNMDGNVALQYVDVKLKAGNANSIVIEIQFLLISMLTQLSHYEKQLFVPCETASNVFKSIHTITRLSEMVVQLIHVEMIQRVFLC